MRSVLGTSATAASFQEAVAKSADEEDGGGMWARGVDHIVLGGGVGANSRLQALMGHRAQRAGYSACRARPCGQRASGCRVGRQVDSAGVPFVAGLSGDVSHTRHVRCLPDDAVKGLLVDSLNEGHVVESAGHNDGVPVPSRWSMLSLARRADAWH